MRHNFSNKRIAYEAFSGFILWLSQLAIGAASLFISAEIHGKDAILLGADFLTVNYYATFSVLLIWVLEIIWLFPVLWRFYYSENQNVPSRPEIITLFVFMQDVIVFGFIAPVIGLYYFMHIASWLGYALLYFTLRWRINHISGESSRSSQR